MVGVRKFGCKKKYIEKVLEQLNMNIAKPVSVPFEIHFKLIKNDLSKGLNDEMELILQRSIV